jgi:hypothetical protein
MFVTSSTKISENALTDLFAALQRAKRLEYLSIGHGIGEFQQRRAEPVLRAAGAQDVTTCSAVAT